MSFTEFECELINWIVAHSPLPALVAQLAASTPISREYTGAGLFLDLEFPASIEARLPPATKSPIEGPQISAPSIPHGASSLVFHEHGRVRLLEVYTNADPMSGELTGYRFDPAP